MVELANGIEERIEIIKARNSDRLKVIRQERIRLSIRAIVLGVEIEKATAEKDVITTTATITTTQLTIAKSTAAEIESSHTSSSSQPSFSHTDFSKTSFSPVPIANEVVDL